MAPVSRRASRRRQARVWCVAGLALSFLIPAKAARAGTIPGFGANANPAARASFGDLFPEKPTAAITGIDSESGVITAKDSSSGLSFTFKLTNPLLLKSLTVGQPLFVNMQHKWVSIEGSRINGNIVSVGDGANPADSADAADDDQSEALPAAAKPAAGAAAKTSKTGASKQAGKPAQAGAGSQAAVSGGAISGGVAQPAGAGVSAQPPNPEAGTPDAATDEDQPASPADAASPAGIADKARQLAGVDAVRSTNLADMAKPTVPADAQPSESTDAATPTGPVDHAQPVVPAPDDQTAPPATGAQPAAPAVPAQPAAPMGSAQLVPAVRGTRPIGARLQGSPCQITNVDSGRGLITARENRTGRAFQFRLADASLARSLSVGQAVTADFAARRVSLLLNGQTVGGSIVSLAPPAAPR